MYYEEVTKKKKKGNALSDVFDIMKALMALQEQLQDVKDSLDDQNIKAKIEEFDPHIDAMYDALQTISADGVRAIRKRNGIDGDPEITKGPVEVTPEGPAKPSIVTSPTLPSAPRGR